MDDKQINWESAPDWATGWATTPSGRSLWIGEEGYAYVGREKSVFEWADDPRCMHLRHKSELKVVLQRPGTAESKASHSQAEELLAALEACKCHLANALHLVRVHAPGHHWLPNIVTGMDEAKAAIAKAKGGAE